MKFLSAILLAGIVLGALANCSKGDGGGNNASQEMPASCLYSGCNTAAYYSAQGFSGAQNTGYAAYSGINCSYGYPVYSSSKGAGCANVQSQQQIYINGTPVVYVLNNQTGTFQAYSGYGYGMNSNVQAYRSCDGSDSCPSDQSCRSPFGQYSSSIGICYRN